MFWEEEERMRMKDKNDLLFVTKHTFEQLTRGNNNTSHTHTSYLHHYQMELQQHMVRGLSSNLLFTWVVGNVNILHYTYQVTKKKSENTKNKKNNK